jgi:two-component system, chemotaxis family, CheB/CheR fusion protein
MEIPQLAERILLSEYAPAFVVVDKAYNVIFVRGDTGKYLKLAEGHLTANILDLARQGLRTNLSLALRVANSQNSEATREGIKVKTNGSFQNVTVTVRPLSRQKLPEYFMVIFREASAPEILPRGGKVPAGGKVEKFSEKDLHITELEQDLQQARENLQSTVEELEASNEELKASNEELLSSNEELQSTNEELETSREELRSVNEELTTSNTENLGRIEQLTKSEDNMRNLLNTIEVATVFLDTDLNVKSFTPAATKLFSLRESDLGRPIGEINSKLKYGGLEADARGTLNSLVSVSREIETQDGLWYSLRIIPYRTRQNEITGLVLTFLDIDEKRVLQAALHFTQSVIDTVMEPMLVLDRDLKVVSANRSFYKTFQVQEKGTLGNAIYELGNRQWDIPELRKLLEEIIPQSKSFDHYQVTHNFPQIGKKKMLLNARRLYDEMGTQRVLLAIEDITGKKRGAGK